MTAARAKTYSLYISGRDRPLRVSSIENGSVLLAEKHDLLLDPLEPIDVTIVLNPSECGEERTYWRGPVIATSTDDTKLQLCVRTLSADGSSRSLFWRDLPKVLDVFDGGYGIVDDEAMGRLLDDITDFHDVVSTCLYMRGIDRSCQRRKVDLQKPESLREISELSIVTPRDFDSSMFDTLSVLQIDLFEQTYFLVVQITEVNGSDTIVALTNHCYVAERRNGKRCAVENLRIAEFEVLDVGDFGIRLRAEPSNRHQTGDVIYLPMPTSFEVPLCVVSRETDDEGVELRLHLEEDSPEIRRHWQQYVQKIYYPNLEWRTRDSSEDVWKIYEGSGYLDTHAGDWLRASKSDVISEWLLVDQCGPDLGITAIGNMEGRPQGTIGIIRLSDNAWLAQAAAMSDKPENMPVTRSLYSWRTRSILMQKDGDYHVALFDSEKRFLDRFFRKFYLQMGADSCSLISWNEWHLYFARNHHSGTEAKALTSPDSSRFELEPIHQLIANDPRKLCSIKLCDEMVITCARPFLHIYQICTGVWLQSSQTHATLSELVPFDSKHSFYSIYSKKPLLSFDHHNTKSAGRNTLWTCGRELLESFCGNSLRSLELMRRKYGAMSP